MAVSFPHGPSTKGAALPGAFEEVTSGRAHLAELPWPPELTARDPLTEILEDVAEL
jgi:hypothetical protein